MYLKEIIIEGFKSYAGRTVIKDFDPSFNAITGLNGSGKSNVLDSICFVLGITNLSQVRASSLQELVYKGGQAGVTKASVTLIFDNYDKERAPVGYEDSNEITVTRQIVIGGRNKYYIDGLTAQPGRVQNLFHSVGLNVNNPHFLIMQGRITKVINMKPLEVLAMIEEAAGTKMYENKKEAALRTIEKKERKVEEINSLLEDKINPSLAKLERERKHYLDWNSNQNELETLKRYLVAHEYSHAVEVLQRSGESELEERGGVIEAQLGQLNLKHQEASVRLDVLTKEREKQLDNGVLEEKQNQVDELGKKIVKMRTSWMNQKEALARETEALNNVQQSVEEQKRSARTICKSVREVEAELEPAEDKLREVETELEEAETALLTGASAQGSQSVTGSAIDQLETARWTVSTKQAEIESLKLELKHVETDLSEKSSQLARDRANVRALEAEMKKAEKSISDAKLAVHELDFNADAAKELNTQIEDEKRIVAALTDTIDQLSARLASCDFQYADPYPNFDRRKVNGIVAKLVRVKDPKMTTAIEVTAGGRLYQIVVDTDATANDILKRGRLARRVTILPLNKIRHEVLSHSKIQAAKEIEPSTELALTLIGYDQEVAHAIEHVFGRTLICPDMDSAKQVTFDRRVRTRSVTLEGDTYDPSGTASGGSSSRQGSSVLIMIGELNDAEAELHQHHGKLEKLEAQACSLNERGKSFRQLQSTLQMREEEARLLEKRLGETATGRLLTEVEALKERYNAEIPEALKAAKQVVVTESEKVRELEMTLKDSKTASERALREAEAALEKIRTARVEAASQVQDLKDRHSSLVVDLETTEEEVKRLEKQISDILKPSINKLQAEVLVLETKVAETRVVFETAEKELEGERERLTSSSKALKGARKEVEDLSEKTESLSLEKAKLDSKIREASRGRAGAEKAVFKLEKNHPWIQQEKQSFGMEGGEYEFTREKLKESREKAERLEVTQEALAKKINKKAMHLFETAKEEYRELMKKKDIIEKDKEKIRRVIAGLDEKKMVALEKTWRKVNMDFGNIFRDLLPGTSARLEPPEGMSAEDGLEIRVAFGDVWKDSLSELSGGQRSLIALSLILAMLRFKPAPMYILDEVDAALDLSHTQNIGRMLRRHFSDSQFIVVSLKEGMFGNANVIFRTKFVDGVSTILRTENSPDINDKDEETKLVEERDVGKENVENEAFPIITGRKRRAMA